MVSICPSHLNTDLISSIPPEKMSLMDLQCHFHQSSIQKINSHFPIHWHLGSMNQLRMINRHPSLQVCLGSSSQFCGFQRKEFPPQCVHPNCFPQSALHQFDFWIPMGILWWKIHPSAPSGSGVFFSLNETWNVFFGQKKRKIPSRAGCPPLRLVGFF